jgi:uncharacterized protein (TIGR02421 family)
VTDPPIQAALEADRHLAALSKELRFLLNVTPTNADREWERFRESGFRETPVFHYRPLTFDPVTFKRALYEIDIAIEDPLLAHLFEEKRTELDRGAALLQDRDTPRFLQGCIQMFGTPDAELAAAAEGILSWGPDELVDDRHISREEFAARAREEISLYRDQVSNFGSQVEIRDDMTGIMVLHGDLLLGADVLVADRRVEPLIHHEIGTHALTWENGLRQPLSLLSVGLACYDETQEALAVFAEYAVGGLDPQRLELIAGRVIAANGVIAGLDFTDVFRMLTNDHGFDQRSAWNTTMRAFRGGGTTKDIIYLRGILRLLEYLGAGRSLEPLLIGKMPLEVVPLVEKLLESQVLEPPAARPRWMSVDGAAGRIARATEGLALEDLVTRAGASL